MIFISILYYKPMLNLSVIKKRVASFNFLYSSVICEPLSRFLFSYSSGIAKTAIREE